VPRLRLATAEAVESGEDVEFNSTERGVKLYPYRAQCDRAVAAGGKGDASRSDGEC